MNRLGKIKYDIVVNNGNKVDDELRINYFTIICIAYILLFQFYIGIN